jgi:hypothetical protein
VWVCTHCDLGCLCFVSCSHAQAGGCIDVIHGCLDLQQGPNTCQAVQQAAAYVSAAKAWLNDAFEEQRVAKCIVQKEQRATRRIVLGQKNDKQCLRRPLAFWR